MLTALLLPGLARRVSAREARSEHLSARLEESSECLAAEEVRISPQEEPIIDRCTDSRQTASPTGGPPVNPPVSALTTPCLPNKFYLLAEPLYNLS